MSKPRNIKPAAIITDFHNTLSLCEKNNFTDLSGIKNTVAHELIHFQQDSMKQDTTTLSYAIGEGMADFIGELINKR